MDTIKQKLDQAEKIIREVRSLRETQKKYFKYREDKTLQQAKLQEKKIDEMISEYYRGRTQSLLDNW